MAWEFKVKNPPNDRDIIMVARKLSAEIKTTTRWEEFGMNLLQTDSNEDMKLIDPEDKKPLADKCKDFLDFWKSNSDHPQWEEVIEASRNTTGLRNLATALEESLEASDTKDHGKAKIGKKRKATLQSKDKTDAKKPKDNPSIDKDICANAKKKVMDVYEKLMMINADAILPGLFGKSVIALKDKQTIDAMKLNPEKMKHLIDNIILPRLEANIINKFKEFLEILERSDDIMIKDIAKQIGNSEDFPEMT